MQGLNFFSMLNKDLKDVKIGPCTVTCLRKMYCTPLFGSPFTHGRAPKPELVAELSRGFSYVFPDPTHILWVTISEGGGLGDLLQFPGYS